ncbi:MAG: PD40 domain-containing protein [Ignavibacteria bacterium]|nr:PD40 domain-containing protein [Ignavibacteria bacterium]
MKKSNLIFLFSSLFFLTFISSIYPQFGQNKVQYKEFKWKYIQTKHFDVYFNQGGQYIGEFAAVVAESSLSSLTRNLDYHISNRIPLVIFNSHNEFQQNNILDEYLPEGVGGVTELFKNRALIPFEGDYEKFRHVIHHELLHAFMNDMFYGGSIQNIISKNITLNFPIWFNEGMAEVQSLYGLDKKTDMFMRDAVINNYVPPLDYINGYFAYRGGQSFFAFLADVYGEEKIGELMNNIKTFGDVDMGFQETYKLNIGELSDKWLKYLKKMYWPDIDTREETDDFSKRITDHRKDGGFYNVSPVLSPKGDKFAFISNRDDNFDIFIADANTGRIIEKVVKGETSVNFEELHILTPGLTWSPDGRKIAVSVKAGSKDAIFIIDVESGDKDELPIHLDGIFYVTWSPVNKDVIAFVGNNSKQSDIYIFNLKTNQMTALTNDVFSDLTPTWSHDGQEIYFNSDRGSYVNPSSIPANFKMSNYDFDRSDLYKVNINTKEITRQSDSKDYTESYVMFSPDGKRKLFISDKNGISNLYIQEADTSGNQIERPITNSLNPIDQISLSRDGKKLLFVALNEGGYDIFSIDNPLEKTLSLTELPLTDYMIKRKEWRAKFGTDYTDDNVNYNKAKDSSLTQAKDTVTIENKGDLELHADTLKLYGDDISLNLVSKKDTNYSDTQAALDSMYRFNKNFSVADNVNEDGSYKIKNYKINFTPDLVYGNANYSSFYGVQGVATIALSDMMGSHRIYIQTSMVVDLKNSDYAVAYYYLPKRIDYGVELFHTARFILYTFNNNNGFAVDSLFRYRTFGGDVSASYPFNKFKRIQGSLTVMGISRENLDNENAFSQSKTLIIPSASFVHDNTTFGYTAPIKGTRYNLTAMASPKLGEGGLGFTSFLGDFRTYYKIADEYSFVMRFAGGYSMGPNPQRFYIGGTDNWLNREFENNTIPINNIEEYAFSTPGIPLRGFNYDRMAGSKYALMNLELRFPLLRYFILGALPIGFANIEGTMFVDAGTAWSDNNALQLFEKVDGSTRMKDLLMGTGVGARAIMFGIPLKFDVAWSYDLRKFSPPKYYLSLGVDF